MTHNWSNLKRDYLKGEYKSLKDFAEYKGIAYRTVRKMGAKWGQLRGKIEEKGDEKTVEKVSDHIAEMNVRHIIKAQELIETGSQALERLDFESAVGAVNAIKTGIEIEREIVLPKGEDASITLIIDGRINHPLISKLKAIQNQKEFNALHP
ncbi:MAG: hypothetical protein A2452_12190 [Candidatus Firestonebacteria bacterium RIFOXYC2_FULL_39_67]|nr:MAG: hypothetical protein A2536_07720 [Candidatus Firestonebacteria bacterium RIFOXYD2_FULL_39_29]OGF55608.1 MAG: hypothetical protein A2452_12190 [Candidatus Firestonebacteria bacterium RIFOXYC2_FULL_39_67]